MKDNDFNSYMLQTVEKVRERLHSVENSLAATSSAMLTFNQQMGKLIELQKEQTSELEKIKDSIKRSRAIIEFFEKKSTWYVIIIVLLVIGKKEIFDIYAFLRSIFGV